MEVKNTTECYVYVFGKETDGTSYTLFPYPAKENPQKTKYSPFCGITGYRLFPKGQSMMPDSVGTRDIMAVVVSKQPLNWYSLNNEISRNPGQDYGARLNAALASQLEGRYATGRFVPGKQEAHRERTDGEGYGIELRMNEGH